MLRDIASIFTALGVLLAVAQLRATKRQARATFEDALNQQYREIARRLPVAAFLTSRHVEADHISERDWKRCLPTFYRYFDLCNEQVFLRYQGRISHQTWIDWRTGIEANLSRPHFKAAWLYPGERASPDFRELRNMEDPDFDADPAQWRDPPAWELVARLGINVRRPVRDGQPTGVHADTTD